MHTDLNIDLSPAGHDGSAAPYELLRALDANPRFRRDSLVGGIFHLGKISYRDTSPTDSVHILIDGDKVSGHVDEISPLRVLPDGTSRYAWGRVLAHSLLVVIGDAARRFRGEHGEQRCHLRCQIEWFDDENAEVDIAVAHDHDHEAP